MDEYQTKQAKLDSVDFLMVILTRLKICSEFKAMKFFQHHRSEIFYKHKQASGKHKLRLEK